MAPRLLMPRVLVICCIAWSVRSASPVPRLESLEAAFSRFNADGLGGTIREDELSDFIKLAAGIEGEPSPKEHPAAHFLDALRTDLADALGSGPYGIIDILRAAESLTTGIDQHPGETVRVELTLSAASTECLSFR